MKNKYIKKLVDELENIHYGLKSNVTRAFNRKMVYVNDILFKIDNTQNYFDDITSYTLIIKYNLIPADVAVRLGISTMVPASYIFTITKQVQIEYICNINNKNYKLDKKNFPLEINPL